MQKEDGSVQIDRGSLSGNINDFGKQYWASHGDGGSKMQPEETLQPWDMLQHI